MLKRYQVLLNDWLADFLKLIAEGEDVSFSEMIRLNLCAHVGEMVTRFIPGYKFKYTSDEVYNYLMRLAEEDNPEEEAHKYASDLYFETRKAVEHLQKLLEKKDPSVEHLLKLWKKREGGATSRDPEVS